MTKDDIRTLRKLTNLTKLNLPSPSNDSDCGCGYREDSRLQEFLTYLTKFTELREIKFNDNFIHRELLGYKVFEKMAKALPFLEVFHFPSFNPVRNGIVQFVRFSKYLKELYIGLESYDFNDIYADEDEWMKNLIIARKSHQSDGAAPLKFFIEADSSAYVTFKELLQRDDFGQYVCVEAPPKDI